MNRKKTIALILACVMLAVLFVGCDPSMGEVAAQTETPTTAEPAEAGEASQAEAAAPDAWTILVYMCGTDLESKGAGQATVNLNEMFEVPAAEGVNIVLQTGGTEEWSTEGIDPTKLQRFEVKDGALNLVDEQPLASMGNPMTVYSFLKWGLETYPAEKTGFVFWNHGSGSIEGAELDELYNYDGLKLHEMDAAFRQAYAETGVTLEFVGFDACLMATIETAQTFAPYANYLVASEETEPGGGWNYTPIIEALNDNLEINGAELGAVICDTFYTKHLESGAGEMITLSVTDLSKVEAVVDAFDEIAEDMTEKLNDAESFGDIARGAYMAERYSDTDQLNQNKSCNMVDIGDLVANVGDYLSVDTAAFQSALEEAIVYRVQGVGRAYATGLAIYYPITYDAMSLLEYEAIAATDNYFEYVRDVHVHKTKLLTETEQEEVIQIAEEPHIANNRLEMEIAPACLDYIQSVTFELYKTVDLANFAQTPEDQKALEDAGVEEFRLFFGNDNDLYFDEETGLVQDNFDGFWPSLDGQHVQMNLLDETDKYILYTVPVKVNGTRTNLRVAWIWDDANADGGTGHFEIFDIWSGTDEETGLPAKDAAELKEGDVIEPIYALQTIIPSQGRKVEQWLFSDVEIVFTEGMTLEYTELADGEYYYGFKVVDIFGDVYQPDAALVLITED